MNKLLLSDGYRALLRWISMSVISGKSREDTKPRRCVKKLVNTETSGGFGISARRKLNSFLRLQNDNSQAVKRKLAFVPRPIKVEPVNPGGTFSGRRQWAWVQRLYPGKRLRKRRRTDFRSHGRTLCRPRTRRWRRA